MNIKEEIIRNLETKELDELKQLEEKANYIVKQLTSIIDKDEVNEK